MVDKPQTSTHGVQGAIILSGPWEPFNYASFHFKCGIMCGQKTVHQTTYYGFSFLCDWGHSSRTPTNISKKYRRIHIFSKVYVLKPKMASLDFDLSNQLIDIQFNVT